MSDFDEAMPVLESKMTRKAWRQVLLADPCAYCGQSSGETDHILPRHANGEDDASNLTGACKRCNRDKAGRSLLSFISGHDVGHRRALAAAPAPRPSFEAQPLPQGRWISVAEERSLRLFAEGMYRLAYKAKHGELPPKRPLPVRLAWPDDVAA